MAPVSPRVYSAAATHYKATDTASAHATTRNEDVDRGFNSLALNVVLWLRRGA